MRKRILSIALIAAMAIGFLPVLQVPTALASDGHGSNGRFLAPIEAPIAGSTPISTRAELDAIRNNLEGAFHLTNDIDLSGANWVPIGEDWDNRFRGRLDGQGFVIRNMTIHSNAIATTGDATFGLIGVADNSIMGSHFTVENLGLEDIDIQISGGTVNNPNVVSVGGLLASGGNENSVSNSYVTGNISITGTFTGGDVHFNVGGIGASLARVRHSYNEANIFVDKEMPGGWNSVLSIGGISGNLVNAIYSHNLGNISVTVLATGSGTPHVSAHVGGIVGAMSGLIRDCYNLGSITVYTRAVDTLPDTNGYFWATARSNAGGIVGSTAGGSVTRSFNLGILESTSSTNNTNPQNANPNRSYAFGISGGGLASIYDAVSLAGGIFAETGSYSIGAKAFGGSLGTNNITLSGIAGVTINDANETLSESEFRNQALWERLGFDFDTVWKMPQGSVHPIFQGQTGGGTIELPPPEPPILIPTPVPPNFPNLAMLNATVYHQRLAVISAELLELSDNSSNLGNALEAHGFTNITHYHTPGAETPGHVFASKRVGGTDIIAVVIRGTERFWSQENASNFNILISLPSGNHLGFHLATDRAFDDLQRFMDTNGIPLGGNTRFLLTGHSRGGAIANLLAIRLYDLEIPSQHVFNYNFGMPQNTTGFRGLDTWNPSGRHNNIFNIVNSLDFFSYLPGHVISSVFSPIVWGRYGRTYWFVDDNEPHYMSTFVRFVRNSQTPGSPTNPITDIRAIIATFNSNIDIHIYNSNNTLVAEIVNNELVYHNLSPENLIVVFDDNAKHVAILDGEDYRFAITGTDTGVMNFTVSSVNLVDGEVLAQIEFLNVPVYVGRLLRTTVGEGIGIPSVVLHVVDADGNIIETITGNVTVGGGAGGNGNGGGGAGDDTRYPSAPYLVVAPEVHSVPQTGITGRMILPIVLGSLGLAVIVGGQIFRMRRKKKGQS